MTSKQNGNSGCGKAIVIIGVIASIITIFTFITGIFSLKSIFGSSPKPVDNPQPINTIDYVSTTTSEEATLNAPTATNASTGSVRIVVTSGSDPLPNMEVLIVPATQDIAGKWTAENMGGEIYKTDSNGVIQINLDKGAYAIDFISV